jgi:hypothetical protein
VLEVRQELVQDSWLALLSGREIAHNGLPHHDTLFAWTTGRDWIDQQWLAHLGFYGLWVAGGVRLVLAAHVASIVAAAAIVVTAARRRGASSGAVFLSSFVCLAMAPWALQMRAQSLAELLFAACFVLLIDRRAMTGRRLAAILALLVLWANVHGTVVLGATLAVLRGATLLADRADGQRAKGVLLLVAAPACVFISPYGTDLVRYYHLMLANPLLPHFVSEWQVSAPGSSTAVFYVVLVAGVFFLARHRRSTGLYDKLAFILIALSALQAIRSIVWFGLAAVPILSPHLDGAIGRIRVLAGPVLARAGLAVAAAAAIVAGLVFAHPAGWFVGLWPARAATEVGVLAAKDPAARIFAEDRYADWLLWSEPQLSGRIAYDIRFELLTNRQFHLLARYRGTQGVPPGLRGYSLFVSEPGSGSCFASRCRTVYRDQNILVARASP